MCEITNKGTCRSQMPFSGGDEGDRTPYLLNAIQALSRTTRKRTPLYEFDSFLMSGQRHLNDIYFIPSDRDK